MSGLTAEIYRIPDAEVKPLNQRKEAEKTTIEQKSNEPIDPQAEKWTRAVDAYFGKNKNTEQMKEDLASHLQKQIEDQAIINAEQQREIEELKKEQKNPDSMNNYNPEAQGKFVKWNNNIDNPDHIEVGNASAG
ncbi:hypothetical protein BSK20_02660 [SR1 bacterium human oral taxon HOT-345]|nr:hypothetical protein BSK20_02660 [SR1 bacterium human oral taxon HOT-345]